MLQIDKSMLDTRAEEACFAEIHDKRYKELISQVCKIQKQMKRMVPKKRLDKFFRLSEKLSDAETMSNNIAYKLTYKQGFMDGLEIAVLLLQQKK